MEKDSTPAKNLVKPVVDEAGKSDSIENKSTLSERPVKETWKSETGECESTTAQPKEVARSGDVKTDAQPEKGYAETILNKFRKKFQSVAQVFRPRKKINITPDRSDKVEYVVELIGYKKEYDENRVDTCVYENNPKEGEEAVKTNAKAQEVVQESGMDKINKDEDWYGNMDDVNYEEFYDDEDWYENMDDVNYDSRIGCLRKIIPCTNVLAFRTPVGPSFACRHIRPRNRGNQCKDVQQVLIDHYKTTCLTIRNLADNNDIGLEYVCIEPTIKVLRQSKGNDGLKNVQEETTSFSCRNIFFNEEYRSKRIYITGEAGSGKSMLCKTLVRLWCEAHGIVLSKESESSDSEDEISGLQLLYSREHGRQARNKRLDERKFRRKENREILSHFTLLFYISLKDAQSEYSVSDMIQSQILKHHESLKGLNVSVLLENEICLVILDGLDEWVCPTDAHSNHSFNHQGIPGTNIVNEKDVFLTTSRPWKFHALGLNCCDLDKHIELCELDEKSSVKLCSKVVKLLNKRQCGRKTQSDFFSAIKQKGLGNFKTIPIMLIQLICLWFDNQDLGKSQVQLYCAMLDLLLKRSPKTMSLQSPNAEAGVTTEMHLPRCIMEHPHCQNRQQLIYCLSRVAFEALFAKTKENSLVFKSSQLEMYGVGKESIDIFLQSGILSQSKLLDKCAVSEKKISFLHKKFQELLAAIFIASCDDVQTIAKRITDFCSTLDTCLEMSQLWLFMSGIRPDIAKQLLKHFTRVIAADRKVEHYRQTLHGEGLIRDIQTCVVDCIIEGSSNGHSYDSIVLEDFYVDNNTACQVEQLLSCTPMSKVKSLYIDTASDIGEKQLTNITGQLLHGQSVLKLHLYDFLSRINISTVVELVNKNIDTLTCLELSSDITATHELVTDICSISSKCLIALKLEGVRLAHEHIEQILTSLSQSSTIKHLHLSLHCTDHLLQCRAIIDMSTMTHIQTLDLKYMSVENMHSVSHCVEYVRLTDVILPVRTLCEFAHRLSQTTSACGVTVKLCNVTVTDASEQRVNVRTFFRSCNGLKMSRDIHRVNNNTWTLHFTKSSQQNL